ncbi:MAG: adenylate/guanylate cyclase domain-containing protein, partial [Novipirellula sp. JB048]
MPDLVAQGPQEQQRWRRALPDATSGRELLVGRADSDWNVPWDAMISRRHARIKVHHENQIEIIQNDSARNPIFYRGRQAPHFKLTVGEHFVIGETTFTVVNRPGASEFTSNQNVTQHAYDHAALRRRHFRDASSRIEVLSRLPDLITSSETDEELLVRMTNVLLQSTPAATAVAIVALDHDELGDAALGSAPLRSSGREAKRGDRSAVQILHYDSRTFGQDAVQVSARLARAAIENRESMLQIWSLPDASPCDVSGGNTSRFTTSEGVDWAFCVPLRSEACRGWAIYVAGQSEVESRAERDDPAAITSEALQDDLKFAELVGSMAANLRQSHRLERRQASMRQFFAPFVMEALAKRDAAAVLQPREARLSVMFCDLRGFTQRSEQHAGELLELLNQVSASLGVMTRAILDTGGVIGDFHGDAAMGFWGWPLLQSDQQNALRAANAAVQIRRLLASQQTPAAPLSHGIGIAIGNAVAGQIGTVDQVKVTAFGPVVNLASRLEGLTKPFGVQTIIDQATAEALAARPAAEEGAGAGAGAGPSRAAAPLGESGSLSESAPLSEFVTRRLALVRPAGFTQALPIFELTVAENSLDAADLTTYQDGLEAFIEGDWGRAHDAFAALADRDRPSQKL